MVPPGIPWEKAMAPHSSTLAWKIPWMEEPVGLQSMGSLGVRHDWATSLSLFTFMHWRRKWQPTPVFLPGESQIGGTWWTAVCGVAQSRTRLKWLSSSSRHSLAVAMKLQFLFCLYKTYCSVSVSSPYLSLVRMHVIGFRGFPGGSDGKETTCNTGDLSSIPGLGRSPGGGHGNPL